MILDNNQISEYINNLNQEHELRKEQLLIFAMNCSDFISLSEAYYLPCKDRIKLLKLVEKRAEKINAMKHNK